MVYTFFARSRGKGSIRYRRFFVKLFQRENAEMKANEVFKGVFGGAIASFFAWGVFWVWGAWNLCRGERFFGIELWSEATNSLLRGWMWLVEL